MKSLRESMFGIACVLTLVACGYAYLRYDEQDSESLPLLGSTNTTKPFVGTSVKAIDWSADSRLLMSFSHGHLGPDGPLLVHDRTGARKVFDIDGEEHLASAALSHDGLHVLIGNHRGQVLLVDTETSDSRIVLDIRDSLTMKPVALSPDGQLAAGAANDGRVYMCDVNLAAPPRVFAVLPDTISRMSFSSDGRRLIFALRNGWVRLWDLAEGKLDWEFAAHDGRTTAAAFLSGGQRIVTAGSDDTVRIWDIAGRREEWTAQFGRGAAESMALSADGKTAAWAGFVGKIFVWDLERRRPKLEIPRPWSSVMELEFSPDGKILAAAGIESLIRLYDASTGTELPGIEVGGPR